MLSQQENSTAPHEEKELIAHNTSIPHNPWLYSIDSYNFSLFSFIKNLPALDNTSKPTLLPKKTRDFPTHTLVLDLDETLVHCTTDPLENPDVQFDVELNGCIYNVCGRLRPFYKEFLQKVSALFEVVIFTASQKVYADTLINIIDPDKEYIQYRLFRDACVPVGGNYLKDLSILGRDLSKVIIVDNAPQAFGYQLSNGVPIESWYDDMNDRELMHILDFVTSLTDKDDVRPHIANQFKLQEKLLSYSQHELSWNLHWNSNSTVQ